MPPMVGSVRQDSPPDRSSSAATSPEPSDCSVMPEQLALATEERILVESHHSEWLAGWMQPIAATPLQMGNLLLAATAPA